MLRIRTDRSKMAELRIKKGFSVAVFAEKAGVSKESIYSIEGGRFNPSPLLARKISEILEAPYDDIFSLVEGE